VAARSKARKRALDILFASELRSEDPVVALERAIEAGEGPTNDYTTMLVRGVVEHRERIDEVLTTYSKGWTLSRMPAAMLGNAPGTVTRTSVPVRPTPDVLATSSSMRSRPLTP